MATGGAEGAREATEAEATVAQRRLVCAAAAGVVEPCVGLRLHAGQDAGGQTGAAVDDHGEYSRECLAIRLRGTCAQST